MVSGGKKAVRNLDDIEKFLSEMPGPCVASGSHRARLWEELRNSNFEEKPHMMTVTWKRVAMFCCVALALAGSGWAAYQAGVKCFIVEKTPVVNPDGSVTTLLGGVGSDDPNFTEEDANRTKQLMDKAVAEGRYKFVGKEETEHGTRYSYIVDVDARDGKELSMSTLVPLPDPKK
jgi:hypothetical protein